MFRRKPRIQEGSFSYRTRALNLRRLTREPFDLLIIGGGITGAAISRDAAMRGMKTALIEKGDFAAGTSSKSSKMIHGGLRYLKQMDIDLVKESLAEREKLLKLAPHLVQSVPFLIPNYAGLMERIEMRMGLIGYDFLKRDSSLGRHRHLSIEEVRQAEPLLHTEKLSGGFIYYDCLVDDARLTLANVKSAHEHGAVVANYVRAIGFEADSGSLRRVKFYDELSRTEGETGARVVAIAAGPWTDELFHLPDCSAPLLRPTKGIHVVFPRTRLCVNHVVVVPTADKRIIFAVPRDDFTYAGTTDTDYTGSLDTVPVESGEVDYLLNTLNQYFPSAQLTPEDIVSTWAGLRPLLSQTREPSKMRRDYQIFFNEDGVAAIVGGKLTIHRAMAANLLDQILQSYAHRLPQSFHACQTDTAQLTGGEMAEFGAYLRAQTLGLVNRWKLAPKTASRLVSSYGRNHLDILAIGLQNRKLLEPLFPGSPVLKAEVVYAVEDEMALTLDDFMSRRTELMHFDNQRGVQVVETVARLMGHLLGWKHRRRKDEIKQYHCAVQTMLRQK
ncbi:MAG: glycerol-3-phosphate dehydrogenase [Desulfobacteraceae bacterium]